MKRLAQVSMILTATMLLFSGCNAYNKMQANVGDVTVQATPEVVVLKGDVATTEVLVTFPPKYFYEDMVLKLTPVLMYEGGEIEGTPKYVTGEDVRDNYPQISWKYGGHYRTTVEIPYSPEANLSILEIRIEGKSADNCKSDRWTTFAPMGAVAVANGISNVGSYVKAPCMYVAPHGFQKVRTVTKSAELHYGINSAEVRTKNLTDMDALKTYVAENKGKQNVKIAGVHTKGYASPDGSLALNNSLSDRRAANAETVVKKQFEGQGLTFDNKGYGEDWCGFEKLLRESNIVDKDFALQLIAMYSDVNVREREMRNLGYIWNGIVKEVLPPLRRAEFVVESEVTAREDAEIMALARRGDKNLSKTDYLYAATMAKDNAEKVAILRHATDLYGCCSTFNNLAVALAEAGDYDGAMVYEKKALAKHPDKDEYIANAAAIAIMQGDFATARQYLEKLDADEYKGHHGLIFMKEGNYPMAAKYLEGYNLAVLETANGNYAAAKQALTCKCPKSDYLRAVIAMKEGKDSEAVNYLNAAIAKDPSLREVAENDPEFARLRGAQVSTSATAAPAGSAAPAPAKEKKPRRVC